MKIISVLFAGLFAVSAFAADVAKTPVAPVKTTVVASTGATPVAPVKAKKVVKKHRKSKVAKKAKVTAPAVTPAK